MANQINRESLKTSLEDRYGKSKVGGAFDAKSAGVKFTDGIANDFADGFTRGGKNSKLPKKDSSYLKGHSTQKYKG